MIGESRPLVLALMGVGGIPTPSLMEGAEGAERRREAQLYEEEPQVNHGVGIPHLHRSAM